MRKMILAALATTVVVPAVAPVSAVYAQDRDRYRDDDRYRDGDRSYRGDDGRYYRCKKSSGTTGTIAGGAGGALAGNVLGGGVLGTVAGGVGGALLGRHLDKKHDAAQNRKNGC